MWQWEDPKQTAAFAAAILCICLLGDMEYFVIYLLLIPLAYMTVQLWNRISGRCVCCWQSTSGAEAAPLGNSR